MRERLIVVGADAAGMAAASQARRRRDADDLEILAFERGAFTSYSACGIPYWIGDAVEDRDDLIVRTAEEHRRRDIDVRLEHEVVAVDVDAGEVVVRAVEGGGERRHGYDHLLLATGATPTRPPLPGIDAPGVFGVQTLDDGARILDHLERGRPDRAVVVGGGYIGLEMAEAMQVRGIDVTVVDQNVQPMRTLDADMGAMITAAMEDVGISVMLETPVEAFVSDREGSIRAVALRGGDELAADIVVLGMGATPTSRLARDAGVPVGPRTDAVVVDQRMRTPVEGVWAAGDCAEAFHRITRRPVAFALGTIANKQGRVAGINLGGGYETFPGVVGTSVTKVCGAEIARTGCNSREAEAAGFEFLTETIESTTRAGYFPGARRMTMKVIVERRSGRLLGAQIVGEEGAAKRIDVFALALWNEMHVDDLLNADLSYAPPFSPVWDPVLIAARKAWSRVEHDSRRDG